ncbi:hypothetical protein PG984_013071 [Apiospora sp. TS-2023a]
MDQGDRKIPHPLDSSQDEEDEHAPDAPDLPSYQEATSELRQPPPAYLARDATNTPGAYYPTTTILDEKRRAYHDAAPTSSSSSQSEPLKYIVTVESATLQREKRISIEPAVRHDDDDGSEDGQWGYYWTDTRWEVSYDSKYTARMTQCAGGVRSTGPEPSSHPVAEFKYPEFIWPGWCGVDIVFGSSLGNGNGSGQGGQAVGNEKQRLQQYYSAMERGEGGNPPAAATTTTANPQNPASSASPHGSAAGAALDLTSLFSNNWTPFTPQYLVDAQTESHVLAQYTRSAPWASERGILEVFPSSRRADDGLQPQIEESAFIEGIVISCAAMVGMQDRLGLVSSLVEAGAESYAAGKGKGRA